MWGWQIAHQTALVGVLGGSVYLFLIRWLDFDPWIFFDPWLILIRCLDFDPVAISLGHAGKLVRVLCEVFEEFWGAWSPLTEDSRTPFD